MALVNVTLNTNDMGTGHVLSNGNLTDTSATASNIRATHGKSIGKWYWEVKFDSGSNHLIVGITNKLFPITSTAVTGTTGDALNFRGIALASGNRMPENTAMGTGWVVGNVVGIALDLVSGTLEFYKNGVSMGVSHTNIKGMGEVFPFFRSNDTTSKSFTVNFGNSSFSYPIPSGYLAFANYPISKLTVKNSTSNKHYSLDNKTLIHLPSSSSKNMILHGIESGKEIKLDEDFDKMKYVKDASEVLGNGKKFTHVVDTSNTKINKITL